MWFAQDTGFACTLPLGLGLPRAAVVTMPEEATPSPRSASPRTRASRPARDGDQDIPNGRRGSAARARSRRAGGGRGPGAAGPRSCRRCPVYRGSTAQVQGLYPWLFGGPSRGRRVPGIDCLTGGAFSCHPLAWLAAGLVANPNIVVTGEPGAGKSATVKALALRLMPYGVETFVCGDLKNEYAPLARALGAEPVELGPGLPGRLNPLDAGPLGENLPADRRRWPSGWRRSTAAAWCWCARWPPPGWAAR